MIQLDSQCKTAHEATRQLRTHPSQPVLFSSSDRRLCSTISASTGTVPSYWLRAKATQHDSHRARLDVAVFCQRFIDSFLLAENLVQATKVEGNSYSAFLDLTGRLEVIAHVHFSFADLARLFKKWEVASMS